MIWIVPQKRLPLDELTEHVIEVSGLLNYHRSEKGERGQARVENLQELVTATRLFEPEDEEISPLQAFLDSAALDAGEGQADPYEDSIQMMTLHSAKGLEFPLVFHCRYGGEPVSPPDVPGGARPPRGRAPFGLCRYHPGHEETGDHLR